MQCPNQAFQLVLFIYPLPGNFITKYYYYFSLLWSTTTQMLMELLQFANFYSPYASCHMLLKQFFSYIIFPCLVLISVHLLSQMTAYQKLHWSTEVFLSSFCCLSTFQASKKLCYIETAPQRKRRHWRWRCAVRHTQLQSCFQWELKNEKIKMFPTFSYTLFYIPHYLQLKIRLGGNGLCTSFALTVAFAFMHAIIRKNQGKTMVGFEWLRILMDQGN